MSWFANVMKGDSQIRTELMELAARSKDESLSANERLYAMFELAMAVQAGEELQSMIDNTDWESIEDNEPKYEWRNGARVRVK